MSYLGRERIVFPQYYVGRTELLKIDAGRDQTSSQRQYSAPAIAQIGGMVNLKARKPRLPRLDPFGDSCHNILFQSIEAVVCESLAWIAAIFSAFERQ